MPGPYAQGTQESLVLGFENGFKTLPGPVIGDKVPVTTSAIVPNRNKFVSNALTGVPEPRPITFGKIEEGGSFGLECNPASMMPALRGLFGGWRTSGLGPLYTQEYWFGNMLPMFIRQAHAGISQFLLWQGIYIGSTTWQFGSEGVMDAVFNVMGAREAVAAADQVTGTITDRTGYDPFSYMLVRVKQGGAVIAYSQTVDLTIDRKIAKAIAQDQTNEVALIFSEIPLLTGKMIALFPDASLLNLALSGAETSLEIWVPGVTGYGLLIELPTIKFLPPNVVTAGTGLVTQDLAFDAYGKVGASKLPGRARSNYFTIALMPVLTGLTLVVSPDGAANQTFTMTIAENTPDLVVTKINATATGMVASIDRAAGDTGGVIRIESLTKGSASSIQVQASSTAAAALGFDAVPHSGFDGKSILVTLLGPLAV
jgi:hypothetical protein